MPTAALCACSAEAGRPAPSPPASQLLLPIDRMPTPTPRLPVRQARRVGTARGGEMAAILSTITSVCRRHGINPQVYLTQLLKSFQEAPSCRIDDWLPDRWKAAQNVCATPSSASEPS